CRRKRRSSWRVRSPRPSPTPCSACGSTTTTRFSAISPARCADTTFASCRATGSRSSCRRTTWTAGGSPTATS
ncbi:MAG: Translation initiation factor 1, partial [uncultured Solirubrobacterales bacterium]